MDPTTLLSVMVGVLVFVVLSLLVTVVWMIRGRRDAAADTLERVQPAAQLVEPSRPPEPAEDEGLRVRREAADRREEILAEREHRLNQTLEDLIRREAGLVAAETERVEALSAIAGLSPEDARAELMAHVEKDARLHAAQLTREIESEAKRSADAVARRIIVTSIQRLAAEQTTESVVAAVPLPGDEMKGRIIGREGRNIRAFEQITGVNVLIDDTPESVLLSCFDPVRRETARITLTELVADGRIHPARIEEVHERSQRRVEELCIRAAEDALIEMGITDLAPGHGQRGLGAVSYTHLDVYKRQAWDWV